MKTLLAAVLLAPALAVAAGAKVPHDRAPVNLHDKASLQRGAQVFVNHCLSCHGAAMMRYNRLTDLGLSEAQVRDILLLGAEKVGDPMATTLTAADGKKWFGVAPPDLSLIARSRGADWLYTYLRGLYRDPQAKSGWNNTVFPNVGTPGSAHAPMPAGVHTPPAQQPFGQLVASQTQLPLLHRRPAAHGWPEPQRQLPPLLQVSVRMGSHAAHATPFFPHEVKPDGVQVLPVQQPPGQVVELHPLQVPPVQVPPSQPWHCAPPAPQLGADVPVRQVPSAAQQPVQLMSSQTHALPPSASVAHRCPAAHAGPAPHRQAPLAHAFAPTVHVVHAPPEMPHVASEAAWHAPPTQQPFGHDSASQVHCPPTQL